MKDLFATYDELRDSLSVSVKIDHTQVFYVVVGDLINKRQSCVDRNFTDAVEHYDYVLKCYLGDEDFEKYVINKTPFELT